MARSRPGFALLLVLWVLASLALVMTVHASLGRGEIQIARSLRDSTAAEMAADDAIYRTIFQIIRQPNDALGAEPRTMSVDGGFVDVAIIPEEGKININAASQPLLVSLLHVIGLDNGSAMQLATSIVEWREGVAAPKTEAAVTAEYYAAHLDHSPPVAPFESLDELGRVVGMTSAIQDALRPHLTLYSLGGPDIRFADPIVRQAIRPFQGSFPNLNPQRGLATVTITAHARIASGAVFTRSTVARIGSAFPRGFSIIEWRRAF